MNVATRLREDIWSDGEKLNSLDRMELDKPFREEEIRDVIFLMEKNKRQFSFCSCFVQFSS
jgi:hypothetical protein